MQFKVPQDVQREDRIVGPLTFKQLIICGIGGIIAYMIYISLAKTYLWITWLPPIVLVTAITLAFAFVRPLDLSFGKWIIRWIEYTLLPRKRLWIKSSADFYPSIDSTIDRLNKKHFSNQEKTDALEEKKKKMEEISEFLNTQQKQ
jgi:hypothetical protein